MYIDVYLYIIYVLQCIFESLNMAEKNLEKKPTINFIL